MAIYDNNTPYGVRKKDYRSAYYWIVRAVAITLEGNRCRMCNASGTEVPLEAHHRTYENGLRPRIEDLTPLCESCHDVFTDKQRRERYAAAEARKAAVVERDYRSIPNRPPERVKEDTSIQEAPERRDPGRPPARVQNDSTIVETSPRHIINPPKR